MNKKTASCFTLAISLVLLMTVYTAQPLMAQTDKGIELCNEWKFQEAEKVLKAALKTNPQDIEANFYLGLSVLMQGKHEEALKTFLKVSADRSKAKSSVPNEYQLQIALARTRLELQKNDEALKNLEAARKLNANGVEVHTYQGVYYLNLKKTKQAVEELEKAINIDENDAYAHYFAGKAYLQSGQPDKAKALFIMFLKLAPRAPEASGVKFFVDTLC